MIVSLLILLCPPLLVVITLRSIDWVSHFKIVFQFPYSSPAILALVALLPWDGNWWTYEKKTLHCTANIVQRREALFFSSDLQTRTMIIVIIPVSVGYAALQHAHYQFPSNIGISVQYTARRDVRPEHRSQEPKKGKY